MKEKQLEIEDMKDMEFDELMEIPSELYYKFFECWAKYEDYTGKDMLVEGLVEYFRERESYIEAIKKACPLNWQEKLRVFEKVSVCLQELSNIHNVDFDAICEAMSIIENLEFDSDTLYVTFEKDKLKEGRLFLSSPGGDEITKKSETKYSVWWD